jgi:tubulin--tyrosine ligase
MKNIITDVVKASYLNLDKERKQDNFELFGFDFMLDKDLKPYLIEINFNPCLVVNCNVLNRIIPPLIENTFRIGLDPLLPPKNHLPVSKRHNLS